MAYYGRIEKSRYDWLTRPIVLNSIAALIGCSGLILGIRALQNSHTNTSEIAERKGPRVIVVRKVLVANQELRPGDFLKSTMFISEAVPLEGNADNFITENDLVENRYASSIINKGSPIKQSDVSDTWIANGRVTDLIHPGQRAVTIEVDQSEGIEGWAAPQARVDVTWTSEYRGKAIVSTVVENALIVSIERSRAPQVGSVPMNYSIPRAVTMLVSIKDAQRLQLAKQSGELSLSLRGENDHALNGSETLISDNLLREIAGIKAAQSFGTVEYDGKKFEVLGSDLVAVRQ